MSRTDDDSWDITEGVGATALMVAGARAAEADSERPLFTDPYAHFFLEAATEAGWRPPYTDETLAEIAKVDPQLPKRMQAMAGYTASRTKYFDDFFTTAGANGLDQVVILASGLDTRAWRLPWISGTVVYEIDQPKVLEFKARVLARHGARPAARFGAVPVDLRRDWPAALRQAGFDPSTPTAWSAEGLLPYLSADGQDLLFDRIADLSAEGSRIAVEAFTPAFYSPERLARRREQMRAVREAASKTRDRNVPDTEQLWYLEPRADVVEWLQDHGWEVTAVDSRDLMAGYQRAAPDDLDDAVPDSVFVEGSRS